MLRRPPALRGTLFVRELGGQNHDDETGPIGNCVAEERTGVTVGIGMAVEDDPTCENGARNDAQRVAT